MDNDVFRSPERCSIRALHKARGLSYSSPIHTPALHCSIALQIVVSMHHGMARTYLIKFMSKQAMQLHAQFVYQCVRIQPKGARYIPQTSCLLASLLVRFARACMAEAPGSWGPGQQAGSHSCACMRACGQQGDARMGQKRSSCTGGQMGALGSWKLGPCHAWVAYRASIGCGVSGKRALRQAARLGGVAAARVALAAHASSASHRPAACSAAVHVLRCWWAQPFHHVRTAAPLAPYYAVLCTDTQLRGPGGHADAALNANCLRRRRTHAAHSGAANGLAMLSRKSAVMLLVSASATPPAPGWPGSLLMLIPASVMGALAALISGAVAPSSPAT